MAFKDRLVEVGVGFKSVFLIDSTSDHGRGGRQPSLFRCSRDAQSTVTWLLRASQAPFDAHFLLTRVIF